MAGSIPQVLGNIAAVVKEANPDADIRVADSFTIDGDVPLGKTQITVVMGNSSNPSLPNSFGVKSELNLDTEISLFVWGRGTTDEQYTAMLLDLSNLAVMVQTSDWEVDGTIRPDMRVSSTPRITKYNLAEYGSNYLAYEVSFTVTVTLTHNSQPRQPTPGLPTYKGKWPPNDFIMNGQGVKR